MKLKCHSSIVAAVVSSSGLLIAAPDARQAFDGAYWLWPTELGQVTNTMVEFRQVFTAPGPASLTMSVAADTVYAVKLNGELVRTGRFPDVPPQRYFDVMGIGNAHAGENELIVGLYVQGADSFQTPRSTEEQSALECQCRARGKTPTRVPRHFAPTRARGCWRTLRATTLRPATHL